MPEQILLAVQIRDKLDASLLPRVLPKMMWTGYGHENPCAGCGDPVRPTQIGYEFEMIPQDSDGVVRFHIGCLGMWLAELRRRGLVKQTLSE
jgi:hypothetical protein